jgi:hypothetical protein
VAGYIARLQRWIHQDVLQTNKHPDHPEAQQGNLSLKSDKKTFLDLKREFQSNYVAICIVRGRLDATKRSSFGTFALSFCPASGKTPRAEPPPRNPGTIVPLRDSQLATPLCPGDDGDH